MIKHFRGETKLAERRILREGAKDDSVKLARFDLMPADVLWELACLYGTGAIKYDERNWELGIKYGRVYGALNRHLNLWWLGEEQDSNNKQHHLDSVIWNAMALRAYQLRGMSSFDDRPNRPFQKGETPVAN